MRHNGNCFHYISRLVMVFKRKICPRIRGRAYSLRQTSNMSFSKIAIMCKISKSSAKRLCEEPLETYQNKKRMKPGRKRLLSKRDERCIKRALERMRKENVNFTIMELVNAAGIPYNQASYNTFVRILHAMGYACRPTRRKGILTDKDKKKRLQFAKKELDRLLSDKDFWTKKIAFYLDGVSFIYKRNPKAASMNSRGRVWRLRSEGLKITSKGSKNLAGGKRLHLMVAFSYKSGVINVEEYTKMNGDYFAGYINRNFNTCFQKSILSRNDKRLFVMDNDPSQNSCKAKTALRRAKAHLHTIPARSPDINPIENLFHNIKRQLQSEAITKNIERESFDEFKIRVKRAFENYSHTIIDKTIASMPKRLKDIVKLKGCRTKY